MWEEQPSRPVVRITTFGPFLMEWLDSEQHYTPVSMTERDMKGVLPARSLLKLLLCQPHRYAPRDWVLEQFWLLIAQGQRSEAEVYLRNYVVAHPTDEDVLRSLLELLGKQERYQELLRLYQTCETVLADEDRQPDSRTQDIVEYFKTKQIMRVRLTSVPTQALLSAKPRHLPSPEQSIAAGKPDSSEDSLPTTPSEAQGIIEETNEPEGSGMDQLRRALVRQGVRMTPAVFAGPIMMLPSLSEGALSATTQPLFTGKIGPETLDYFAHLTEICRNLSEGNDIQMAERILWSYLPEVSSLAQDPFEYQQVAANIASQGHLLAASLSGHRNDYQTRKYCSEQALLYGELANDSILSVASLRQLAVTFDFLGEPEKVLQTYQKALPHLDKVPSLLRSSIYAALSGICAHFKQTHEVDRFISLAYESFEQHDGDEPSFLRTINASQSTLVQWDAWNQLQLGQPEKAKKIFEKLDVFDPKVELPKKARIEAINERAEIFTAMGEMQQARIHLEVAIKMAIEVGSDLRLRETVTTYQKMKKVWPHEDKVERLGELLLQHMVHKVR